jgi:hypothetical protein
MIQFDFVGSVFELLYQAIWDWLDRPGPPPKDRSNDPEVEASFKKLLERNSRLSDPVYKRNLQRLIEHHRQFEDAKE